MAVLTGGTVTEKDPIAGTASLRVVSDTSGETLYCAVRTSSPYGPADQEVIKSGAGAVYADSITSVVGANTFLASGLQDASVFYAGFAQQFEAVVVAGYVRADGTAPDKASATDKSSAATSMSLATFMAETLLPGEAYVLSGLGGSFGELVLDSVGQSGNRLVILGEDSAAIDVTASTNARGLWLTSSFIRIEDIDVSGSGGSPAIEVSGTDAQFVNVNVLTTDGAGSGLAYGYLVDQGSACSLSALSVADCKPSDSSGIGVFVDSDAASVTLTDVVISGCNNGLRADRDISVVRGSVSGSHFRVMEARGATITLSDTDVTTSGACTVAPSRDSNGAVNATGGNWTLGGTVSETSLTTGDLSIRNPTSFAKPGDNTIYVSGEGNVLTLVGVSMTKDSSGGNAFSKRSGAHIVLDRCILDWRLGPTSAGIANSVSPHTGSLTVQACMLWGSNNFHSQGLLSPGTGGVLYFRNNSYYYGRRIVIHNNSSMTGEIINNSISGELQAMDFSGMTVVSNNNIFNSSSWGGVNETADDPLYVDPDANLRLQPASPCRTGGVDWWTPEPAPADIDDNEIVSCRGCSQS